MPRNVLNNSVEAIRAPEIRDFQIREEEGPTPMNITSALRETRYSMNKTEV